MYPLIWNFQKDWTTIMENRSVVAKGLEWSKGMTTQADKRELSGGGMIKLF